MALFYTIFWAPFSALRSRYFYFLEKIKMSSTQIGMQIFAFKQNFSIKKNITFIPYCLTVH